jgi:hypothetical protein
VFRISDFLQDGVMSSAPKLLVSVRSADEVAAALTGGADLIDVKEPAKGALAPAEAEVVAAVVAAVKGKVPVSAALGEWSPSAITDAHWHLELKLNYVKWGLAGYTATPGWGEDLLDTRRELPVGMEMVAVAYAEPRHTLAGLHDSHTEFVSEQLYRRLGLQAALDLFEGQRADSEC